MQNLFAKWPRKISGFPLILSFFTPCRATANNGPTTMATLESTLSVFSGNPRRRQSFLTQKPFIALKFQLSLLTSPSLSQKLILPPSPFPTRKSNGTSFRLCFSVQEVAAEEAETEQAQVQNMKRKLYVFNLPWSLSVVDIKNLFGECGTVKDVEVLHFPSFFLMF